MKIAFFCGRPFGLRGTTGTYKVIEKCVPYVDMVVFAPPRTDDCVYEMPTCPLVPVRNPGNKDQFEEIKPVLKAFDPDIVYIFNFPKWTVLSKLIKENCPQSKMALDIQTPLLIEGKQRREIQENGNKAEHHLDTIMTLSKESVLTWIPKSNVNTIEYPLGIDLSMYRSKDSFDLASDLQAEPSRFVYVSSLHPKRKTETLINGFAAFVQRTNPKATLDIFGSGPDFDYLQQMLKTRNLQESVHLHGLVQQDILLERLSSYDAGIAWVPKAEYSNSPSWKIIEYMAAGLPVIATNTNAHAKLLEREFFFDLTEDNAEDLAIALKHLSARGGSKETILKNLKSIAVFDYDRIVQDYFLPLFKSLKPDTSPPRMASIRLEAKPTNGIDNASKLSLFLFCNTMARGKGGAERVAMGVADEMTQRGHRVYMGYQNSGPPAYTSKNGVLMMPYDRLDVLERQVRAIDPHIFFVFYFNRKLIQFYSMVHNANIPFGMQECTNPQRLCENNWGAGRMGKIKPVWERELIASVAARIRLTMPGYALTFPEYIRPQVRTYANPAFPQTTLSRPAGDAHERKTILNINGFKANKNLLTLLKAFAPLAEEYPDWDVRVIGKSPEGKEPHKLNILNFIEENNLSDRVIITGPTDDVYSHFVKSHIHVIASLSEGCPTVVLEAMSAGLPSIGYADCPGTNELIQHGKNGLLCAEADRVESLISALKELMHSAELRERLGQKALEDSEAFEPKRVYDQWEALFYEAAAYKDNMERLLQEQMEINEERALHTRRMRHWFRIVLLKI